MNNTNENIKVRKPWYKRVWVWILVALVVFTFPAFVSGDSNQTPAETVEPSAISTKVVNTTPIETTQPAIEYIQVELKELFDALNDNALLAERTYNDAYVTFTGHLGTIDSDGKYIGVYYDKEDLNYFLSEIQCFITDDSQLDKILAMKKDDEITITGQITDIGEILGYHVDISAIE